MTPLHIIEPFWSAWKFYGWDKPIPGIGIAGKIVSQKYNAREPIFLTIGKDKQVYTITPEKVYKLGEKYNSRRYVRRGLEVIVIPQNELEKYVPETVSIH